MDARPIRAHADTKQTHDELGEVHFCRQAAVVKETRGRFGCGDGFSLEDLLTLGRELTPEGLRCDKSYP